jgi:ABC-type multidrug transport system fused ATPase/permease subunit
MIMRRRSGRTAGDTRGALPRLVGVLAGADRARLVIVTVFAMISVGFLVAGPLLLGEATDIVFDGIIGKRYRPGESKAQIMAGLRAHGQGRLADMFSVMKITPGAGLDFTHLGQVLGLAALAYLAGAVFSWAQGYLMAGIALRTVYRLRQSAEEKLSRLPLSFFDSHPHGEVLSRVTNDIDNITTTLQEGLSPLLTSALTVLAVLGAMFWLSPLLAAVSLVVIPLAMLATALIARRSKVQFVAAWTRVGKLNGLVEQTYTGHPLVLGFGQRRRMTEEFRRVNEPLRAAGTKAQFLSGTILPTVNFVGNLNYVVIAVLGGYQVAAGMITLGSVQAFIQFSRRFSVPVAQIAGQMNLLQSGIASAERVFAFLDAPEEVALAASADGIGAGRVARGVEFQHVSFRYAPDIPLIEDFTLAVSPGQTVAIVGPTGAGKTTVVNLLMRFYEIQGGRILLDGVDYWDLGREEVRRCFGMVLQDTWLFAGTIRDNIGYGKEGATDDEILAAATAAHVDHFVRTLPDGYDTVLTGDASSISSGQRQLLTIARAFLANPGILILDEATSNVDTRTEILIQDAMARLRAHRTSFVIAHRLSTIRNADTIVVMDGGRIVEQGCHHELLSRRGLYHDLYSSQFAEVLRNAS